MSREAYNYKRQAIATAKDLFYPQSVIFGYKLQQLKAKLHGL